MARSRAVITSKSDFSRNDFPELPLAPDKFYNFEDALPEDVRLFGTPLSIDAARGKGSHLNKNAFYRFQNANFTNKINIFSMWVKFDQSAFTNGKWSILFSTRSSSASNHGFHFAMYNDAADGLGQIIGRTYANGANVGLNELQAHKKTGFRAVANTWYHFVFRYIDDANYQGDKFTIYANGQVIASGGVHSNLGTFIRDILVGDMNTNNTLAYPPDFAIDDFMWFSGDKFDATALTKYYDIISKGQYLDTSTEPGSIMLAKGFDGKYNTAYTGLWTSQVIDIGDPPIDFIGRLQVNALLDMAKHRIVLYTQSSDDGSNFSAWQQIGEDGTMYSPHKRYYKIKAEISTSDPASTPILRELQILEYDKPVNYDLSAEPLRVYRDLETGLENIGILNRAYDIWIEEEVKGKEILTFRLPLNDPKRKILGEEAVEFLIRIGNRRFIMKENNDKKGSDGKKVSGFKAEAKWYELGDAKIPDYELVEATAEEHIQKIFSTSVPLTGYKIGTNNLTKIIRRTIRGKWKSVLELLREVEKTFGIELDFDTLKDEINLYDEYSRDNGVRFYYSKNMKEIERNIDTYGMITRLYCYGKGELNLTTVTPNGEDYIENLKWVNLLKLRNKIRPDSWSDERYVIPQNLKDDGEKILDEMSRPNITYAMKVIDLSSRTGHYPEQLRKGDYVYVIDEDLARSKIKNRIMRRKINIREPHKSDVELGQPKKELADIQSRNLGAKVETLTETDPLSRTDVQEMTVFNQLLNSRADDGFTHWIQEGAPGITVSTEGGFSGDNSFKIASKYGESKKISQEVFNVSHRSTYTISAMVHKEGKITPGKDGFIGIRVVVTYKPDADGKVKTETKLLKIPDVTDAGEN
ncbi:phage tail protein [Bacillus mobilis]|uniref:phage tail protein n=3 Tax=Bacillus cereus group TaxID=86661 RepID=UPI001E4EA6EE|nr:phage tail protein [Bacillus mobilis]MCC2459708.1 phage tail protein [Bacillus mobilis]